MNHKPLLSSALVFAVAGAAIAGEITGTVAYRERIALPPNSIVTVRLEDATKADAPAGLISESKFVSGRNQVPLSFKLTYIDSAIQPNYRYFVRTTIHSGGNLIYSSTQAYPVISNGVKKVNIQLQRVQASVNVLYGVKWKLSEIGGKRAKPNGAGAPFVEFVQRTGGIRSNTGVNSMGGEFTVNGSNLKIKPGPQTLMAGPPDMMDQERAFTDALRKTTSYRITSGGLELLAGGKVLAKFVRA